MKSILYVGATLMIGASIYGFVDYKNSSQKTEFKTMYEAVEEEIPVVTEKKKPIETKITAETSKKPVIKKSSTKESEFLPLKSKSGEFVTTVEPIPMETEATVKTEELKEKKAVEKIKSTKSKKVNHKLFSRGSLEERYIEKTLKLDSEPKEETKKTEVKEEL